MHPSHTWFWGRTDTHSPPAASTRHLGCVCWPAPAAGADTLTRLAHPSLLTLPAWGTCTLVWCWSLTLNLLMSPSSQHLVPTALTPARDSEWGGAERATTWFKEKTGQAGGMRCRAVSDKRANRPQSAHSQTLFIHNPVHLFSRFSTPSPSPKSSLLSFAWSHWHSPQISQILMFLVPLSYELQSPSCSLQSCAWSFLIAYQLVAEDFWSLPVSLSLVRLVCASACSCFIHSSFI